MRIIAQSNMRITTRSKMHIFTRFEYHLSFPHWIIEMNLIIFHAHTRIYIYIFWEQTFINASFIKEVGTIIIDYLLPGIF